MDGKLLQIDGRRVISFERYLNHPVEKVWKGITSPAQIARWLTAQAELELKVDGQLTLRWDNGDLVHGKFSKVDPPYELEYTWLEQTSGHSVVRWWLKSEGEGCRLHLTHTFYESAVVLDFWAGWHVHLDVLDEVLHEKFSDFPWEHMKEMREKYAATMKELSIQHRTFIHATPDKVYETLTTGAGWDAWFTQGTTVDARPGGMIHFRFKDFGPDHITLEDGGTVLEAVPGEKFVYQWTPGDSTTTISFQLTKLGDGTLVSLVESGYTQSEKDMKAFGDCAVGWGEALTLLKFYLEHGITYGAVPKHDLEKSMTEQYAQRTDQFKNIQK
jgi:uncharacterized protein YndB with AHSA1/START domain